MMQTLLPLLRRLPMQPIILAAARFARPLTMGVRVVIFDQQGRVLLVRHTYVPGWHLPGGGVEPGETAWSAAVREAREEAGVLIEGEAHLHGVFLNRRRDHVVVYVVREFRSEPDHAPDWEIAERRFFATTALPNETTKSTRARLAEVIDGAAVAETW